MARGVLVRWNDERGFGFLRPLEGEGAEVFAHVSAFGSRDGRPRDGEVFDYEFAAAQDGRLRATRVRPAAARARSRVNWLALVPLLGFVVLLATAVVGRGLSPWVAAPYLVMSVLAWFLYARDKRAAAMGRWRVSEATLQATALLGGWPGAVLAQQVLRHKNRKAGFQAVFWVVVALNVTVFAVVSFRPDLLEGLTGAFR